MTSLHMLVFLTIAWTLAGPIVAAQSAETSRPPTADPALGAPYQDAQYGSEATVRRLVDLAARPLDVNTAGAEALAQIPALSPLLARRLVAHRRAHGPFPSLAALRRVDGVSASLVADLRPFLVAPPPLAVSDTARSSPSGAWTDVDVDVLQQVTRRLDLGPGYDDDTTRSGFLGSPERLVTRLRLRSDRLEAGLTLDKDPGEVIAWDPGTGSYGADHVSGTAAVRDLGPVSTLVVGDYAAAFGQGVILWRGSAFGKGADPVAALLRTGAGLDPRSSTEENQFFRGAGLTMHPAKPLAVTAWGSRKRRDATPGRPSPADDTGPRGRRGPMTGLSAGGYHRTDAERRRKNAVRETNAGAAVTWTASSWRVGVAGLHSRFSRPFAPGTAPHQHFDPAGSQFTVASVFGDAAVTRPAGDLFLFGEAARSASGTWGGVAGLSTAGRHTETLLFARWYPPAFWSLHGQALGESGGPPQNEQGIYAGVRTQVHPHWSVAAYVDVYRFPWLRYTVPRPSSGIDARLRLDHAPRPWLDHALQLRAETKGAGRVAAGSDGRGIDAVGAATRQSLRWQATYAFGPTLTLRTRVEGVRAVLASAPDDAQASPARYGVLLLQDVRWAPWPWLTAEGRWAAFDTDDFETRVFAYEYDLLYSFQVPALQGRGRRSYLLLRLRPARRWAIEAKYGVTRYPEADALGDGSLPPTGSRIRELRLQIRWHLR